MNPLTHPVHRPGRSLVKLAALGAALTLVSAPAGAAAAPARPTVKTGGATAVTYQSAALHGSVNPGGQPSTFFFQYGRTTSYGSQGPPVSLAASTRTLSVQSPIGGLLPATRYHYRMVAINATGTAIGSDATFTTQAIPLSLAIGALPNPVVFGSGVSIVGTLTGTGSAGRTVILQQNPFPFTAGLQNVGNPELTSPTGAFQFNLLSLAQTTQFRVVSVGPGPLVLSTTVTEAVGLLVTMHARSRRTSSGSYSFRFSGSVSPAEDGARVLVQRLVGSRWRTIKATNARGSNASSSYAVTLRRRHGGFFRVFATPVEGAHVADSSQPAIVHAGSGL